MVIPTGDYLVEFLDYRSEPVKGASVFAVSLAEAQDKANGLLPMLGVSHYRIMRCIANSTDKDKW